MLLDRGLADALRGAAAGVGIPARVEATTDRYPPDIEAAVYFCCIQVLDAVEQAGPGTQATVRVWPEHESLLFEVVVDGRVAGHDEIEHGSELTGMKDRVGAVGGRLDVSTEPGRTRVLGTIPLAR